MQKNTKETKETTDAGMEELMDGKSFLLDSLQMRQLEKASEILYKDIVKFIDKEYRGIFVYPLHMARNIYLEYNQNRYAQIKPELEKITPFAGDLFNEIKWKDAESPEFQGFFDYFVCGSGYDRKFEERHWSLEYGKDANGQEKILLLPYGAKGL